MTRALLAAVTVVIAGCAPSPAPSNAQVESIDQAVVACANGPTVRGVDVSVYQGVIDWNAVHGDGWDFGIARIGDGTGLDGTFQRNWADIKAAGMIRGAYQFWRAGDDQNQLSDLVINAVGRLGPGDLPVMLDIEGASMGGLSPGDIVSQMNIWLSRVEAGTGKKPLIYTGKYAWDPSVQSANYGSYPLWIAAYGANTGGVPSNYCPNTPMGWDQWTFWQYSSVGSVPGINANVDKSLFNGDLAALQVLADGLSGENCYGNEVAACGNYGCGCVDHQCNGGFCPGTGCTAAHTAACGMYGSGCVDGACNGGTSPGSGCTARETLDCSKVGCGCVDHACNGGDHCAGTGCTWRETHDCGAFGVNCADHQCSGGYGPGNGCTGKETADCSAQGCGCVDHACSGGDHCAGSGSTARNGLDCGGFGCHSVDATCSGGFCPGTGCTGKQTADCAAMGCGCADEVCGGGACTATTGCTPRQTLDCQALDAGCDRGACTTPGGPVTLDAGVPTPAPTDGGLPTTLVDGGLPIGLSDGGSGVVMTDPTDAGQSSGAGLTPTGPTPVEDVKGGCAATPGQVMALALLVLARRRRQ